jgi:hypothetical protein
LSLFGPRLVVVEAVAVAEAEDGAEPVVEAVDARAAAEVEAVLAVVRLRGLVAVPWEHLR